MRTFLPPLRILAVSALLVVAVGTARADRPRVDRLVPDEVMESLASSERLQPDEIVEIGALAIQEMKALEADIVRIGGKDPDCVKTPLQVVATLRSIAEKAQTTIGTALTQGNRPLASATLRKMLIALGRARETHGRVVSCAADDGSLTADATVAVEYLGEGDDQETFSDTLDLFDANGNALDVVDVETDGGDAPPEASPFI
jgi:hypothetical protein